MYLYVYILFQYQGTAAGGDDDRRSRGSLIRGGSSKGHHEYRKGNSHKEPVCDIMTYKDFATAVALMNPDLTSDEVFWYGYCRSVGQLVFLFL